MKKRYLFILSLILPLFILSSCKDDNDILSDDDYFIVYEEEEYVIDKRPLNPNEVLEIPIVMAAERGEDVVLTIGVDEQNSTAVEGTDFEFVNGPEITFKDGVGEEVLIIAPLYGGTPGDLELVLFLESNTAGYNMGFYQGEDGEETVKNEVVCFFVAGADVTFIIKDTYGDLLDEEEATITAGPFNNEPGEYLFKDIPQGSHAYIVEVDGFATATGMIETEGGEEKEVEVAVRARYDVEFSIIDEDDADIEEAVITLGRTTNDPGDYIFEDVVYGEVNVTVEKEGYVSIVDSTIKVDKDIDVPYVLQMETAYKVEFEVSDDDGNPITKGVEIEISEVIEEEEKRNRKDNGNGNGNGNGEEEEEEEYIYWLPVGEYEYTASKEGYISYSGTFEVIDENLVIEPELAVPIDVKFVVEDAESFDRLGGAKITLVCDDTDQEFTNFSKSSGIYTVSVRSGDYTYTVEVSDYRTEEGSITVDEEKTVRVEMQYLLHVGFNLTDKDTEDPVNDATITLECTDTNEVFENDPGDYIFRVIPGEYEYTIEHEDYETKQNTVNITESIMFELELTPVEDD